VCQVQAVHRLFDQLFHGLMASWKTVVCGYGMNGHVHESILLFDIYIYYIIKSVCIEGPLMLSVFVK
jgi:hypothetical protein